MEISKNYTMSSDIKESLIQWKFWLNMSVLDIKNKYIRTVLGPFWVTGTVAVTIIAIGPVFGVIFDRPLDSYLLHLATGMTFWIYISSSIGESCGVFLENATIIKNTDKPKYIYIFRIISRNTIILFHNITIPVLIGAYFGFFSYNLIFLVPFIILTSLLLALIALPVGILSTRYRDFIPFVQNILQLFFFLTPIFWVAGTATARFSFLHLNPFDYLLRALRMPFYSTYDFKTFVIIFIFMIIFYLLSVLLYKKYSNKISYWL